MSSALKIQGLSKRYRLPADRFGGSLRALVGEILRSPFRFSKKSGTQSIWALKDVGFEVGRGEIVGVVGSNGAGKTTLLKVLSRITAPTEGCVEIYGSIASLLEVGTGFHPELTGRENIYLNGSILGMRRSRIRERFDEIVEFSNTGSFLDIPVKRYSSGMRVRLAFAVAAHLDSEILLLDEVLAVGDVTFQRKCLGKMKDAASEGRTVLLVSHDLRAVHRFARRSILLDRGRLIADGPTPQVLAEYYGRMRQAAAGEVDPRSGEARFDGLSAKVRFTKFRVEDEAGRERNDFSPGETIRIRIAYRVHEKVDDLCVYFAFTSAVSGEVLVKARYQLSEKSLPVSEVGEALIEFPALSLNPREYHPHVWLGSGSGHSHDRLSTSVTSCPPITISPARDREIDDWGEWEGYFEVPHRLLLNRRGG